jgi:hypothetical protein
MLSRRRDSKGLFTFTLNFLHDPVTKGRIGTTGPWVCLRRIKTLATTRYPHLRLISSTVVVIELLWLLRLLWQFSARRSETNTRAC